MYIVKIKGTVHSLQKISSQASSNDLCLEMKKYTEEKPNLVLQQMEKRTKQGNNKGTFRQVS